MRRQFPLFLFCLLLVLFAFPLTAFALEETDEDKPLYEMMGFPNEDTFEVFLEFLSGFDGSTADDMAAYLEGSEYGYMEIDPDFCLELYTFMVSSDMPLTVLGSAVRFTGGAINDKQGALNISFQDGGKNYIFIFNNIPKVSNAYVIDFSQYLTSSVADERYVTLASVSGLESKLNSIISNQKDSLTKEELIRVALDGFRKDAITQFTSLRGQLQKEDTTPLLEWTGVKASEIVGRLNLYDMLVRLNNNVVGSANTNYELMRLTDFPVFQFSEGKLSAWDSAYSGNFSTVLGVMNNSLANGFHTTNENLTDYLVSSGDFLNMTGGVVSGEYDLAEINQRGFLGLNNNLLAALTGGRGVAAVLTSHTVDSGSDGITEEEEIESANLNNTLATMFNQWDLPIKQLQAVLADDADLELKRKTAEQVGAVTDEFTGSGPAAPSLDNITDMSGISQGFSGMFDSGISFGDAVSSMNDADAYQFFSQPVADSLDTSSAVSPLALDEEDPFDLSGYVMDEDGFLSLADDSYFSISDFLGKGGGDK